MTTNSQLSTTESEKQKQNRTESQVWRSFGGLSAEWGKGENGENVQGLRSINGRNKTDGDVKNSVGKGEAKKLIHMTNGQELRWGICWREEGYWVEGGKGGNTQTSVTA